MALDLRMKNGFRGISFEYIGILDSYFIHRFIIIKYRSSSIMDKIHRLLSELWPFVKWQCPIYANFARVGASVSHGHISSFLSETCTVYSYYIIQMMSLMLYRLFVCCWKLGQKSTVVPQLPYTLRSWPTWEHLTLVLISKNFSSLKELTCLLETRKEDCHYIMPS